MVDLDNKSEVLDYGENDDLENNKEENSMDTAETQRESEINKKEEEVKPANLEADEALLDDEFQVLDEEASDIVGFIYLTMLKFLSNIKLFVHWRIRFK